MWLRCRSAKASFNRNQTSVPILNANHDGLLLVCVAADLDEDAFARYFFVRYGPRLLSLSVFEVEQDFSFADGFHAVLLIVIVPEIVSSKYISTALGAHKSVRYFNTAR